MKTLFDMLQKSYEKLLVWVATLSCLLAGLYVAINNTFLILSKNNYPLAAIGDGAHDLAVSTYPILLGQQPLVDIYKPFADHRVVIERLWTMYDYLFTQGTQAGVPLRLAIVFWLFAFLLFFSTVLRHQRLSVSGKLQLLGVVLAIVFSGINLSNYSDSILMTWPFILLFSLLAFICLDRYCEAFKNASPVRHFYQVLTFLFIALCFLTFNCWMLLWPVVFIVLLKNRCLKYPSALIWIGGALLSYKLYFLGWRPASGHIGWVKFLHHPDETYLYLSRILSIPLINTALTTASLATVVVAFAILSLSLFCLLQLLFRPYRSSENILFAFFLYFFTTILVIAVARYWMEGEAVLIGLRFTTPASMIIISLIISTMIFACESTSSPPFFNASLSVLIMVWLVAFYLPGQHVNVSNHAVFNRWHILISTGVKVDAALVNQMKDISNEYDVNKLNYLLAVQKKYKKSAFSLWPTQYIGKTMASLHYRQIDCPINPSITIDGDLRKNEVPGIFLSVTVQPTDTVNSEWDLVFNNHDNQIIGYARSSWMMTHHVIDYFFAKNLPLYWYGAINTQLLNHHPDITVWAVNRKQQQFCQLGVKKIS